MGFPDITGVRTSAQWVADHASLVSIDSSAIDKAVQHLDGAIPVVAWDFEGIHFFDNGPLTVQYMLVLDALNFCFWPDPELQYDHLAAGLRRALLADNNILSSASLQTFTGPKVRELLQWPRELPLEDERARLLREVGMELDRSFGGQASNVVASAKGSASKLVNLVTSHFPGFRDHAIYKGHQVFLYKRAQIFVADLWGAFQGKKFGAFWDIDCITMFADYVVPAILRKWGILVYNEKLASVVDNLTEIKPGSEEEVEIRACTIAAVEKLKEKLMEQIGTQVLSIHLDWWLWSSGVSNATLATLTYHRTKTICY